MNFSLCKLFAVSFCSLSLLLHAQNMVQDPSTGAQFPSEVKFEQNGKEFQLDITGVATRKKLIIKVYSIAHYLQKGWDANSPDKIREIMRDDKAKQMTIKYVHHVSLDKIQNAYHESFQKVLSGSNLNQLQDVIKRFISFYRQDAQKGDEQILRWLPGGYVEVIINGNKAGSLTNPEFAKALWGIWFGPKSVVNKDQLISMMQ